MIGTIVNVVTVVAGSALGLALNKRLPKRFVKIFFQAMGLFTLFFRNFDGSKNHSRITIGNGIN